MGHGWEQGGPVEITGGKLRSFHAPLARTPGQHQSERGGCVRRLKAHAQVSHHPVAKSQNSKIINEVQTATRMPLRVARA